MNPVQTKINKQNKCLKQGRAKRICTHKNQQQKSRMRVKSVARNLSYYTTPPPNPSEAFEGLCICFCGNLSMKKREFEVFLEDHGAEVYSSISKNTTHLIATQEEVDKQTFKVKKALMSNVPIVSEQFLHHCLKVGDISRVDVSHFSFRVLEKRKREPSHASTEHGTTTIDEDERKMKIPRLEVADTQTACVS